MAQSVECPTLDFISGHGLTAHETEPRVWLCTGSTEPAWESLSLFLCPYTAGAHALSLSLSQNKQILDLKKIKYGSSSWVDRIHHINIPMEENPTITSHRFHQI